MNQPLDHLRSERGATLLELTIVVILLGILFAIALPSFIDFRHDASLAEAEQRVSTILTRGRWMAITSGQPRQIALSGSVVQIIDPTTNTVLEVVDLGGYLVTVAATNLPATLDSRGFVAGNTPTITITGTAVSRSRTFSIGPLGKVS
jgi:type II secretory pathway pseudopilin PulG